MTLDRIISARRSTRSFDPDRPVADGDIRAMAEAARMAPSACNSQTWRFVAVRRRQTIVRITREAMRPVIPNKWLADAPLLVAGCSRLDLIANRVGAAVTGTEYYQIDLGIAMEHMVLKATELGLGTCWIGWFSEGKVKEILAVPGRVRIPALLAVGYPLEGAGGRRSRKPLDRILFSERWGETF